MSKKAAIVRRKADEERRSVFLRVRITPQQEELFKGAASAAGITVSAWAVERLQRAAKTELRAEAKG